MLPTSGKKNPASGTHQNPMWLLLGIIIKHHLTAPSCLLAHCRFTHLAVTPFAHWCLLPACESSSFSLRLPDRTGMQLENQPVGWSGVSCAYLLWQVKRRNRPKALTSSVWMSVKRERHRSINATRDHSQITLKSVWEERSLCWLVLVLQLQPICREQKGKIWETPTQQMLPWFQCCLL